MAAKSGCIKNNEEQNAGENNEKQAPASSFGMEIYLLSRLLFSSSNGEIPVFGLET